MPGKFLKFFEPFIRVTPEIKQPEKEITFKNKLIYTLVVLVIYLIMSNIPLYMGDVNPETTGTDYYYWLRVILASNRGTLTELGIGPIVTAGLIMQLLQGSKLINVDMADPYDRSLFTGAQKVIAMFLTVFQTAAYIFGGAYGPTGGEDGLQDSAIIALFIQLFVAGIIIILMDEILQKGYGLGSGVSLFIAAGVAGEIFWNSFSYIAVTEGDGLPRGIIVAFFDVLFSSEKTHIVTGEPIGIGDLFIREAGAPGILGLFTTILIFLVVAYLESTTVEIPLTYAGYKGYRGKYPMKLLYVSNIPVILAHALYANVLFFGQLMFNRWGDNVFVRFIGTFDQAAEQTYMQPTGGIAYYLTPPQGLSMIFEAVRTGDTSVGGVILHSIVYMILFVLICIFFAKIWIEVSGLAPRDIAQQIIDSKMQIPGFRRSEKVIEKILKRYIPTLTILCGLLVGLLSFAADFLGALSSGTGLLLAVGIIQNYAETISQEAASMQFPGMAGIFG